MTYAKQCIVWHLHTFFLSYVFLSLFPSLSPEINPPAHFFIALFPHFFPPSFLLFDCHFFPSFLNVFFLYSSIALFLPASLISFFSNEPCLNYVNLLFSFFPGVGNKLQMKFLMSCIWFRLLLLCVCACPCVCVGRPAKLVIMFSKSCSLPSCTYTTDYFSVLI